MSDSKRSHLQGGVKNLPHTFHQSKRQTETKNFAQLTRRLMPILPAPERRVRHGRIARGRRVQADHAVEVVSDDAVEQRRRGRWRRGRGVGGVGHRGMISDQIVTAVTSLDSEALPMGKTGNFRLDIGADGGKRKSRDVNFLGIFYAIILP